MRIMATIVSGWVLSTLIAGSTAHAQKMTDFQIDKTHSSIIFKIKYRDVTFIYGRFNDVSGTISVDSRQNPKVLRVTAKVNPRSVDTNNNKRDRHLKGKEFFDTSKHKSITFETKEVKKLEEKGMFELTGTLTLLGKTQPLTVVFEHTGNKDLAGGKFRIGGQTSFTVKRSDFGMEQMLPEIADEVEILVSLSAELQRSRAG